MNGIMKKMKSHQIQFPAQVQKKFGGNVKNVDIIGKLLLNIASKDRAVALVVKIKL